MAHRFVIFIAASLAPGCGPGNPAADGPKGPPPVPVLVAQATTKDAPVEVHAIGNVEASSTVHLKPQIEGQILRVGFREGDEVRRGDVLFEVDPRPFETALRRTEAELAKDQAELEHARAEADRAARLYEKGLSSKDEEEVARAKAGALEAAVRADAAAIEGTRLELEYCTIRAPADGRTGALFVHPGNVVKARDATLVTIHTIRPIHVVFSVPEAHLGDVTRAMSAGPLSVRVLPPGEKDRPIDGVLAFVDNAVDRSTGTIRLKATFENADRRLWPGQFVEVDLRLGTEGGAVVVPSHAVQTSQEGEFVFVLGKDSRVEKRSVQVARQVGGESVIREGLAAGEVVVTDGHLRLVPGAVTSVRAEEASGRVERGKASS